MDRAEKIDCTSNGEVIFTGATTKFQLIKGLTPSSSVTIKSFRLIFLHILSFNRTHQQPFHQILSQKRCNNKYGKYS